VLGDVGGLLARGHDRPFLEELAGDRDGLVPPPASVAAHVHDHAPGPGQAEAFGAALTKAGSEAKVVMIKDRDHGSILFRMARADDPATQLVFEFISKHSGLKLTAKPKPSGRDGVEPEVVGEDHDRAQATGQQHHDQEGDPGRQAAVHQEDGQPEEEQGGGRGGPGPPEGQAGRHLQVALGLSVTLLHPGDLFLDLGDLLLLAAPAEGACSPGASSAATSSAGSSSASIRRHRGLQRRVPQAAAPAEEGARGGGVRRQRRDFLAGEPEGGVLGGRARAGSEWASTSRSWGTGRTCRHTCS
jgi:hypothetical protein